INISGVELVHHLDELSSRNGKIIVTCAGRTRGIVATQLMRDLGVSNVYNLENGTMGWTLANFELVTPKGQALNDQNEQKEVDIKANTNQLKMKHSIQTLSLKEYRTMRLNSDKELLYEIDVRTKAEYRAGHIPGTIHLPGGQAVQSADDYIG